MIIIIIVIHNHIIRSNTNVESFAKAANIALSIYFFVGGTITAKVLLFRKGREEEEDRKGEFENLVFWEQITRQKNPSQTGIELAI